VNTSTAKSIATTTSNKIQPTIKPVPGGGSIKSLIQREFLERALASRFLRTIEDFNEEEEEKPFTDKEPHDYDDVLKRFLLGTKTTTTTTARTTTVPISKGDQFLLKIIIHELFQTLNFNQNYPN
jgi:hypothetical protein